MKTQPIRKLKYIDTLAKQASTGVTISKPQNTPRPGDIGRLNAPSFDVCREQSFNFFNG
jgi:hypothetical protein